MEQLQQILTILKAQRPHYEDECEAKYIHEDALAAIDAWKPGLERARAFPRVSLMLIQGGLGRGI